jgi:DNA-binding LacI/PurR family transcriptional regulator
LGLIASEARPGGNVTGIEPYVAGLPAKQIEFAREIVPGASKVGLLTNLKDPKAPAQAQELEASARAAKINIVSVDANRPEDLDGALRFLSDEHVDVVIVLQTSMLLAYSRQIAVSALEKRIPTVYGYREHVLARRTDQLRCRFALVLPSRRLLRRQNFARDRSRGFADRVSDAYVSGDQSQNGGGVGHRGAARRFSPAPTR